MRRSGKEQEGTWTLPALCRLVERALGDVTMESGRVRPVPDVRTIRYYTGAGLLDRPAELRGRTAHYNVRHLLQLVAIKRLQAQGLSLAEVQARLLGLDDTELRVLARLPAELDLSTAEAEAGTPDAAAGLSPDSAAELAAPRGARRPDAATEDEEAFWEREPAPLAAAAPGAAAPRGATPSIAAGAARDALHGADLGGGATLLWRGGRALTAEERAELEERMAPVLRWLQGRWNEGTQE